MILFVIKNVQLRFYQVDITNIIVFYLVDASYYIRKRKGRACPGVL